MIITLPVSHLINAENLGRIPGVEALEYRDVRPALTGSLASLLHCHLGVVQDAFIDWFDGLAERLVRRGFRLFSFDCGPAARKVDVEDYYYVARSNVLPRDALAELIADRLRYVRERFDGQLAIENLNYFPTSAYRHVCEPDFITEVVRDNDVGLVLDIAHAVVTAQNMKVNVPEYLFALPLDRVCAIHLSSPGPVGDTWRDLHGSPTQREYALLEHLAPHLPGNVYVLVEHYASWGAVVADYAELTRFRDRKAGLRERSRSSAVV